MVVVTVNHRLNVFGYLNLADSAATRRRAMAGMLDIVARARMGARQHRRVRRRSRQCHVFGESGGGWKVSLLQAMPAADGLFHKAIIQSGPGLRAVPRETATTAPARCWRPWASSPGDLSKLDDPSGRSDPGAPRRAPRRTG